MNSENKIRVIFTHEHTATDKTGPNIELQKRGKETSGARDEYEAIQKVVQLAAVKIFPLRSC